MDNHIDQVGFVKFEEKFEDKIVHQRTFTKKLIQIWIHVEDIKTSNIFNKMKKFKRTPWASIIKTYLKKLFSTGPLKIILFLFSRLSLTLILGRVSQSVAMSVCVTVCVLVCLWDCEIPTSGCLGDF